MKRQLLLILLLILLFILTLSLTGCFDYCETMFNSADCEFTEKTIEIISPIGGETWEIEETHKIQWKYTGDINNVTAYLCDIDGNCVEAFTTESGSTQGEGEYKWKVDKELQGKYILKISDSDDPSIYDELSDQIVVFRNINTLMLYINNGDAYTRSTSVTLSLTGVFGSGEMRFANNPDDLLNATWENYTSLKFWELMDADGEQTVYGQFRDVLGNITDVEDTIILDKTSPTAILTNTPVSEPSTTTETEIDIIVEGNDVVSYKYNLNLNNNGWTGWSDEISVSNHITESDLPDGYHQLKVVGRDTSGNWQSFMDATVLNWIVDAVTPTGEIIINNNDNYTNNIQVQLSIVGANDGQQVRFSNTSDFTGIQWETFTTIRNWMLTTGDGNKTVYCEIKDSSGEVLSVNDMIILDTQPPTAQLLNTPSSPSSNINIDIEVAGAGVVSYKYDININDSGWSGWSEEIPVSNHITETNLPDSLKHRIRVIGKDEAGNWQTISNATLFEWEIDAYTPGTGEIIINNNDTYTNTRFININIADVFDGQEMRLANSPAELASAMWESFAPSKSWTLSDGDGDKTVYMEYKDSSGKVIPAPLTDTIKLDTTPPNVTLNNTPSDPDATAQIDIEVVGGAVGTGNEIVAYKYNINLNNEGWSDWTDSIPVANHISMIDLPDGAHQIKIVGKDPAGNWLGFFDAYAFNWVVNAVTPNAEFYVNNNDTYTNEKAVSLSMSIDTNGMKMRFSNDGSTWSSWENYNTTKSWMLSDTDGTKTVYCEIEDESGEITALQDNIILDTTAPTAVLTNLPPEFSETRDIDITVGGTDVVAYKYNVNFNGSGWTGWSGEIPITTHITETGLTDNYHQLKVIGRDEAGNWQDFGSETTHNWYIDDTDPSGTLIINNDDTYTNSITVTLSLINVNDCTKMRFSNSPINDSDPTPPWEDYWPVKSWDLTNNNGTKTVYCQLKDNEDFQHITTITDEIILDTEAPIAELLNTPTTADPHVTQTNDIDIQIGGAGVVAYRYNMNVNNTGWTGWSNEISNISNITETVLEDGFYQLKVVGKDEAGNWQSYISSTNYEWTVDTVEPDASFVINGDNTYTPSVDVTLEITATDTTTSVTEMRFSEDNTFSSDPAWVAYQTSYNYTLSPTPGEKTLYAQFRDLAGNETTIEISDSITLDSGATTIIYVSKSGSDSNPGTQTQPKLTIQGAIDYAYTNYPRAHIYVSAGTYNEAVTVKNNISIYGGYNPSNWSDRNIIDRENPTYKTVITTDVSDRAVYIGGDVDVETDIEGFTIENAMPDVNSYAIYNLSKGNSLTISYCTINGGAAQATLFYAYGIWSSGSLPDINNCRIYCSTERNYYTYGIYYFRNPSSVTTPAVIEDNEIVGGVSHVYMYGLYNSSASIIIQNNTFTMNSDYNCYYTRAIQNSGNPTPKIEIRNNTIEMGNGTVRYDAYGLYNSSSYSIIEDNDITPGTGSIGRNSFAMYIYNSNATIKNNNIYGANCDGTSYGLYLRRRTPVVEENIIHGGGGTTNTYGVYNYQQSTAHINANRIYGGDCVNGSSYAIYNTDSSSPRISSNMISGGTCHDSASTFGIYNDVSNGSYIMNNTINGGEAGTGTTAASYGIYLDNDAITNQKAKLYNNIIFTSSGTSRYGVYEKSKFADPEILLNNNIFNCPSGLYSDIDDLGVRTDLTTDTLINDYNNTTQVSGTSEDNVSLNPNFADIDGTDGDILTLEDNDWRLTASTSTSIINGAYNLESDTNYTLRDPADNPLDMDLNPRTGAGAELNWTIGAFEYD